MQRGKGKNSKLVRAWTQIDPEKHINSCYGLEKKYFIKYHYAISSIKIFEFPIEDLKGKIKAYIGILRGGRSI